MFAHSGRGRFCWTGWKCGASARHHVRQRDLVLIVQLRRAPGGRPRPTLAAPRRRGGIGCDRLATAPRAAGSNATRRARSQRYASSREHKRTVRAQGILLWWEYGTNPTPGLEPRCERNWGFRNERRRSAISEPPERIPPAPAVTGDQTFCSAMREHASKHVASHSTCDCTHAECRR